MPSVFEVKAGEMLFRQGDPGSWMYLVQEGEIEVLQEIAGAETQLAVLKRKDFIGEMSLLEDEPRSHSVRALTDAKLIEIDRADFGTMLRRNPEIAVGMVKKLSSRLATTEDMVMRAWAGAASLATGPTGAAVAGNARLVSITYGNEIPLPDRQEVKVGRLDPVNDIHPDVDLTAIDPQISTSRKHALIIRRGDGFYVQEEKATNGTRVNGTRISAATAIEIRHGDEIMFGAVRMLFVVE